MPNPNKVPLTALSAELRAITGERPPGYRQLWMKVVSGELPPVEKVNGQYETSRSDLPVIAGLLGMTVPAESNAPKSTPKLPRKAAVAPSAA